ncbi:hypothetical protein ACIAD2399 [Acinetobacter baylyi ADP1]|uniref:Uncharacterized protein n=1 Tax=Acinetobacter baylyi (strain ATCC 33305 / BD413 / ADP1) TaxID=62977 RepID=Q6F9T9_ACIAD|nr:hypothetical protein ACIAD2399 [Acinetobacter baylyi ADP1]
MMDHWNLQLAQKILLAWLFFVALAFTHPFGFNSIITCKNDGSYNPNLVIQFDLNSY